jgi:cytochrome c oxidase subunit 4
MTEAVEQMDHPADTAEHMDHPTEGQYWLIALVLGVLTAAEVATPAVLDGWPSTILLYALMSVKFYIVVAFFMHLRFDKPLFRNFLLIGLIGAVAMYLVVLLTFRAL